MGRPCVICTSPNAANIDRLLTAGETCSSVSTLLDMPVQALRRHKQNHLTPKIKAVQKAVRAKVQKAHQSNAGIKAELNDEGAPDSMPMPFDADLLGAFDLLQIVHQQFNALDCIAIDQAHRKRRGGIDEISQ